MIISWKISQPPKIPPLKNLIFKILAQPSIKFIPPQEPIIKLPKLDENEFIINWIIQKPLETTEIVLSVQNKNVSEKHSLIIHPKS